MDREIKYVKRLCVKRCMAVIGIAVVLAGGLLSACGSGGSTGKRVVEDEVIREDGRNVDDRGNADSGETAEDKGNADSGKNVNGGETAEGREIVDGGEIAEDKGNADSGKNADGGENTGSKEAAGIGKDSRIKTGRGESGAAAQSLRTKDAEGKELIWKDEKVKKAVYSALGYWDEEVPSREEVEEVEWLRISDAQEVETFQDLVYLPKLTGLVLYYSKSGPFDIDLDETMAPELEELTVNGCNLEGNEILGRLSRFPQLSGLFLTWCSLRDISFLEELPQITHLSLYGNDIEDISPMASCRELVEISLAYNHIQDITALSGLKKLEELGIHGNEIDTLEPLRGLYQLKGVNVTSNRIKDLSPLADKMQLEALGAGDNLLTDIAPIKGLTHLYNLALDYNEIEDISVLADMKEMNWLGLSNNRIKDFGPIMGMEKLFFLSVFNNPVRDVGELALSVPELYLGTADTAGKEKELKKAQQWVDKLYSEEKITLQDITWGDLNGDGMEDMAVTGVSEASEEEKENPETAGSHRKIYVLIRKGNDSFLPMTPIETLSSWQGGIYGDPYQGICISCERLVVETYGGSNWRWGFRSVYGYEDGRMEQKMMIELDHFVYADGYNWRVEDNEKGSRKSYVICGSREGIMEKLLISEVTDGREQEERMEKREEILRQMEAESGVSLPPIDFWECVPDIDAEGEPYGYRLHNPLCDTVRQASRVMEKAAEQLLADAAALPVVAYTSEEIKGNYDKLVGVVTPEEFYIGWVDGKPVRLSYQSLLQDDNGGYVHGILWAEPDEDNEVWRKTAVVYYEEETGLFRKE